MKNDCAKWKEELLEAALTGTATGELGRHLSSCAGCVKELEALRARREQLDALLPLVARGAELPAEFGARVLAAAQAAGGWKRARRWRVWVLAGAAAGVVAAATTGLILRRTTAPMTPDTEVAAAQKLAEWQAPSDVLLETPGQEILRSTPKLGESYIRIPVKTSEEK